MPSHKSRNTQDTTPANTLTSCRSNQRYPSKSRQQGETALVSQSWSSTNNNMTVHQAHIACRSQVTQPVYGRSSWFTRRCDACNPSQLPGWCVASAGMRRGIDGQRVSYMQMTTFGIGNTTPTGFGCLPRCLSTPCTCVSSRAGKPHCIVHQQQSQQPASLPSRSNHCVD
jgi:hypothetical protein